MKNKIQKLIYFICLTILSGLANANASPANENFQISAQLTENEFPTIDTIEEILKKNLKNINQNTVYTKIPQGLVISIDSTIFFENNSTTINNSSKNILNIIGCIIKNLDIPCVIEVSTNNEIEQESIFQKFWEISTMRANTITKYFISTFNIEPEKIQSIGFGEIFPFKYTNNENNNSFNNRIDFILIKYKQLNNSLF